MKDFIIHVERIVRPIRGDSSKLRMRRELFAHLQASFEQERARGLDDAAAAAEAKRRLGDPLARTQELQASIPNWERLSVTPFPKSVLVASFAIGLLIPLIVSARTLQGLTSWQARAILIAGIAVMELDLLLWFTSIIAIFRPRPRWGRAALFGIAASIAQCAWISLIALAATGRAIPTDLAHHALEYLALPLCCLLFGMTAILARLPMRQWQAIEIAD